ncbi:MAG: HDOD domain-containing protein [Candidatus Zixiibacteriota bacterium]
MDEIKTNILSFGELPSQPIVLQKLHQMINSQDTSSHNVAKVIETDQGFTARVLRLVNSPFFGFTRKIASVQEAITMIGFNSVHQLLLATSLMGAFKIDQDIFDIGSFWQHCFAVGVISKHIATKSFSNIKEESFVSGVLHDVGRLLIINADVQRYKQFINNHTGVISLEAEEEVFGINHQNAGQLLAEHWHFPDSIKSGIGFHHTPEKDPNNSETTGVVHVADITVHALDLGDSGNFYVNHFCPNSWAKLNLTMDDFEELLENALLEIDETRQIIKSFG